MASCGQQNYALPAPAPADQGADCEDCVQVVKTTKRVRVPCHRNTYKQYTVKVPRQVTYEEPRTVKYTEMINQTRQVPYQCNKTEQRVRMESQNYQVPVQRRTTKMVNVTKKVPKTVYVNVTVQEPKEVCTTVMENRTRMVKIPYTVNVPITKYRCETFQTPVTKEKTVMEKKCKTVYDTQVRTRCEPKVTMVTKEIPVYNVVARGPQPCPPQNDCAPCQEPAPAPCGPCGDDTGGNAGLRAEFAGIDTNNDGRIDAQEYAAARTTGFQMQH